MTRKIKVTVLVLAAEHTKSLIRNAVDFYDDDDQGRVECMHFSILKSVACGSLATTGLSVQKKATGRC
jgi:hypothetical protein